MSKLIDLDAAINALGTIDCSDGVGISTLKCDAVDDAITVIKELPTVDAVPVRCKDCRWRDNQDGSTAWMPCRALVTPNDFYCPRGERKDGGNNGQTE